MMNGIRASFALLALANMACAFLTTPQTTTFGLNKNVGFLSMSAVAEAPADAATGSGTAENIRYVISLSDLFFVLRAEIKSGYITHFSFFPPIGTF